MYESMDACNIEPLMPVESNQKDDVSLIQNHLFETSVCIQFSGNKGFAAVKSDNEPQLITSMQSSGHSQCKTPEIHISGPFSFSHKPINPVSNQYHLGSPECLIDAHTLKHNSHYDNFNRPNHQKEEIQNHNQNNFYKPNETSNSPNQNGFGSIDTFGSKNENIFYNNTFEEDEFESVINPRSKTISQVDKTNDLPPPSCSIYIQPFSSQMNQFPQDEARMEAVIFPTFSIDLINQCSYFSQDTEDAFASVLYSTPSQIKPVLCSDSQTQPNISHFYTDDSKNYYNNYGFNSYSHSNNPNSYIQSSSFSPFFVPQTSHSEDLHEDQIMPNKTNSTVKPKPRPSTNEYKRYRSPEILISQSPTPPTSVPSSSIPITSESQSMSTKSNSITTISVPERRSRTRKVSSSPSLTKPRNAIDNTTDMNTDNKKPVINFQKPAISSSNNNDKAGFQNENKRSESNSKNKIRGRR